MNDPSCNTGSWSHRQLQELQGLLEEYVGDDPKSKETDASNRAKFRVTIDLLISDKRKRDPDGAINTVMDCLVGAVRRLREGDTGNCGASKKGSQRKRGSNSNTRKNGKLK